MKKEKTRRSVYVTNDEVFIEERLVAQTLQLSRDEKLNVRLPEPLKSELEAEFKSAGFENVSDYTIAILASRKAFLARRIAMLKL